MQNKKISRKIISLVLSLLMILTAIPAMSLTAYADNTETLLTTITATGVGQASYSKENVATVSFDGADYYMDNGWTGISGSVTVNAAEGYTITKCVFFTPDGNSTDDAAPFTIRFSRLRPRVTKVEVYGYSNTSAVSTSYVDGSGTSQTADATELAADTTSWTDGLWYIAPAGGLTISGRITVNGTVNLILRDGATLTANAGITTTNATLNIYAQSAGTGALTAKGSTGCAGIGGRVGGYGSNGGAGGTVSIFGGTVTATGGTAANCDGAGAGIGGGGAGLGMGDTGGAGGTVSIFGGTVTATGGTANSGGGAGAGIGGGGKDMRGSDGASGTLTLGKGVKLYSGTNNSGTVLDGSDSTERSYNGSRPQKMFAEFISGGSAANDIIINSAEHGSVTANPASAAAGTTVTLTAQPDEGCKLKNISAYKGIVSDSFSSQYDVYDYSGTHFNLKVDETSAYGWTIGYGKDDPVVKVTSKSDTSIDRVVLEADAKIGIRGTIKANVGTVTRNGNTITVSGINNKTVTIYSEDYAYSSIESAEVYGKTADYGELTLTGTDDPNVFTFTMPDSAVSVSAEFEVSVDKTDLNTAITAAQTLYDSIKDNTDYSTIASTLKTAIDAAKEVADSETADQDAVDTANGAISDATTAAVVGMINALPASTEVTTSDKDKIEKVRAAYDNLTDAQKESFDTDTLKKLTDAETTLQDAIDTEAAGAATNTINALPAADEVTTADKDAIEAARKAYNDLTDDQKKKVSDDTLKKLTDAEDALKAATVSETIGAIPATDEITLEDKDAVETARAAYDALTDDQKTYVDEDTVKKLTDAEKAIEDLETAKAVTDSINDLPAAADVTLENKDAVEASRAAYDALTDDQKALVSEDTLKKLTDAETAIANLEAAKAVSDEINDLPAAADVTLDDKADVEAARAAYDALTDDQKALVSEDTLKKLTDAEKKIADHEAAKEAGDTINALPKNVTVSDIKEVKAAREAYDALTDDQKAYVDQDTVDKLTAAEKRITDQQAALPVISKISRLPNDVTLQDKGDILAARAAYDALTDDQKHWVNVSTLKKLTDAETAIANIEAAAAVTDTINALPEDVSVDDKDQIEAARAAYDALTDDQKALVSEDTLKKLTDAEEKLAESQSLFEDLSAAMAVVFKISELPTDVTYKDRDVIENTRAAYDALTDDQKALISDEVLKKLTDAEDALAETEKASIVTEAINDLPAADDITLDDKADVEAARAAYDALTDEQKAQVEEETLKKLTDAEAVIADLVAAKGADDKINALPAAADVTLEDKDDVEAARAAYDALTDDQKALVDEDTVKKLTDAETAIENLEAAKAATDKIDEIPDDVTLDDKETVEAAREAYDALSDDQKALVDEDTVKKLTDAETTIENLEAAKAATDKIDEIPDEVTLNDKETVEAAREAYDALSDDQKALVDEDTVNKLTDAETAIENLEAAKAATDKINAIPATDEIALDDKADVEAAREAYDALTDDQKDLVDEDTVKKLTDAEKEIADLEAAKAVADEINDLPATKEITLDDKADVEAAREAYDALTDDQKAKVDKDTVKKLTDAEERETVLQAASEVSAKTGSDATYNGDEIRLVNAPTTELPEGYTMQYALGTDPTTAPADDQYGSEIPTAKDAGTYYVWSKVAGDDEHTGTEAECKTVNLAKAKLTVTAKNQYVAYGSAVDQSKYTVQGLVDGDKISVKLHYSISANKIRPEIVDGNLDNYDVTYVNGVYGFYGSPIARVAISGSNYKVAWTAVKNADGYDVYAGYTGTGSYPLVTSAKSGDTSYVISKINGKTIDASKNVFIYVVAYKMVDGKKVTLVRSASIRSVAINNTKYTNASKITAAQTAYTLSVGRKATIKPTVKLVNSGKQQLKGQIAVRYESCNKNIAKVDANGVITAVGKGTCNLYAFTQNGMRVKIVVTVK